MGSRAIHGPWEEDATDADTVEMTEQPSHSWLSPPTDRRRELRSARELPVTGWYGHHFISCTTVDVSDRGTFLRTSHPPPVGSFVRLGFATADGESHRAEGHVRWVKQESDGRPIGFGVLLTAGIAPTTLPH